MFTQKRRPASSWALLTTPCLPSVGFSQTPSDPREDILARFAQRLTDQVGDGAVGGITAVINIAYRAGSISKWFTAVTLLQLCEKGLLELDNPVIGVLPELGQLNGLS